jgi:hypothetical protein
MLIVCFYKLQRIKDQYTWQNRTYGNGYRSQKIDLSAKQARDRSVTNGSQIKDPIIDRLQEKR